MIARARFLLGGVPLLACFGCVEPLVDDTPVYSPHILEPGREPPPITDDPTLRTQIETYDGIEGSAVARRSAWAGGREVHYWDLGPATRVANPAYSLHRCDEEGNPIEGEGQITHPYLVDSIPGATQYSPFWSIQTVCVTEAYAGERIPSLSALSDAIELGLVLEPSPTPRWFSAPITLPDVIMEQGEGQPARGTQTMYFRGRSVAALAPEGTYDVMSFARSRIVSEVHAYFLEREDDDEYAEVVLAAPRGSRGAPEAKYSPLARVVRVTMAATFEPGSVRDASELVRNAAAPVAAHPDVVEIEITDELRNLEIQWEEEAAP